MNHTCRLSFTGVKEEVDEAHDDLENEGLFGERFSVGEGEAVDGLEEQGGFVDTQNEILRLDAGEIRKTIYHLSTILIHLCNFAYDKGPFSFLCSIRSYSKQSLIFFCYNVSYYWMFRIS